MISDKHKITYKPDEQNRINEVLISENTSGSSIEVTKYENRLADYFDVKHAIALSSGTAAIHCAINSLRIERGDEIIMHPAAPLMTAYPLLLQGVKIIFCDINARNFTFDYCQLESIITTKTKAIITVPMWGYPIEMDNLLKLAQLNKIVVIEE